MKGDDEPIRLADYPGLDPWIVGLLRSAEPYKAQPGRKQRLLLKLGCLEPGRAPRFLRLAVVTGILIAGGTFASAAIGPWRGLMARAYERVVLSSSARAPVTALEPAQVHRSLIARASASTLASAEPARHALGTTAPAPSRRQVSPSRPHRIASLAVAPAPQSKEDTQAVVEGMRALRLERNPVRAREVLTGYLDRYPTGALAEEALALSIEAAVTHHDADAAALAAHYLQLYPAGPFSALAREAQR